MDLDAANATSMEPWLQGAIQVILVIALLVCGALSLYDSGKVADGPKRFVEALKRMAEEPQKEADSTPDTPNMSDQQRRFMERQEQRYTERQQDRVKRRRGRSGASPPKPAPFIKVDALSGETVYGAEVVCGDFLYQPGVRLPRGMSISESEWSDVVTAAAQSELWRRTQDIKHFSAALEECANKKIAKMAAGPRWKGYYQQSQQQQQRQPAEQQRQQPSSHLQAEYVAAGAAAPKLEEKSIAQLQAFIRENPHASSSQAHRCTDRQLLLQLAGRSLQVWECKRILKCSKLPASSTEQEVAAALCVLQLQFTVGAALTAALAVKVSELRRRYQQLARRVHPDKMHEDHRGGREQFEGSFKQLGKAYELLSSYACQG